MVPHEREASELTRQRGKAWQLLALGLKELERQARPLVEAALNGPFREGVMQEARSFARLFPAVRQGQPLQLVDGSPACPRDGSGWSKPSGRQSLWRLVRIRGAEKGKKGKGGKGKSGKGSGKAEGGAFLIHNDESELDYTTEEGDDNKQTNQTRRDRTR